MHIIFVHGLYESLGIEYLSAYLKQAGHEVTLVFDPLLFNNYLIKSNVLDKIFSFEKKLIHTIIKKNPDIVSFSATSIDYLWCCHMAQQIKKQSNIKIVFGGTHPTALPKRVLANDFIDFVICGEGEETMLDLVNTLKKKGSIEQIKNLAYKKDSRIIINELRPLVQDLDQIPFPDKDLFYAQYKDFIAQSYAIITSRGCVYNCSYCDLSLKNQIYKKYYRRRTPDNVIAELIEAKKKYKIKRVNFQDSVFSCEVSWLEDFLPKYKDKIDLPFFCFLYPSSKINDDLINKLVTAGCVTVNMGIQSINPEIRKTLFRRNENDTNILQSIAAIKKTNLYLYLDFILYPNQPKSELIETIKFCAQTKPDFVAAFWLIFFPGTEIIKIFKERSLVTDEEIEKIEKCQNFMPYFDKKNPYFLEMGKLVNLLFISGLFSTRTMKRILDHKMYQFLPARSLYLFLNVMVGFLKKMFKRKFPFPYGSALSYYCKYYLIFIKRRFF